MSETDADILHPENIKSLADFPLDKEFLHTPAVELCPRQAGWAFETGSSGPDISYVDSGSM